jgi:hypothetical protein
MVLALKYIEDNLEYEIDEWFYDRLEDYSLEEAGNIVGQILCVMHKLPIENGWGQEIAGVILRAKPLFFVIEFINQENEPTLVVDVSEIDLDSYLDFIKNNQTIKQLYYNGTSNGNPDAERTGNKFFERNSKNNTRSRSKEQQE